MSNKPTKQEAGAAMEGHGFYNKHSKPQQAAARRGIELLVRAAGRADAEVAPLVIADYGSAEGRNSLVPMSAAVCALRQTAQAPITVVHLDRPGNDFASLFGLLHADPKSYLKAAEEVFALASGGSFYERMLPAGHVSLGWCAIALHWLSRVPEASGTAWPTMRSGQDRGLVTGMGRAGRRQCGGRGSAFPVRARSRRGLLTGSAAHAMSSSTWPSVNPTNGSVETKSVGAVRDAAQPMHASL